MSRTPPTLILISGAPAAGKSSLARRVAADLSLPLIAKDAIKEALGDTLGAPDREASRRLGGATYHLMYAVADWILEAGTGLVLESNFWRGLSEPAIAPLLGRAHAVLVHCEAEPAVIERRFRERGVRGERHPVHFDDLELPSLRQGLASGRFAPLDLDIPCVRVDTTDGYRPPYAAILTFIDRETGAVSRAAASGTVQRP